MELSKVELGIIKSALSGYIAFIEDEIEDNMKAYDGTHNKNALDLENYLSDVVYVFNKVDKEYKDE